MPQISSNTSRTHHSTSAAKTARPTSTPPTPTRSSHPTDGISLSSEALEIAGNTDRCNNDWRCLQQLQDRGLLS